MAKLLYIDHHLGMNTEYDLKLLHPKDRIIHASFLLTSQSQLGIICIHIHLRDALNIHTPTLSGTEHLKASL